MPSVLQRNKRERKDWIHHNCAQFRFRKSWLSSTQLQLISNSETRLKREIGRAKIQLENPESNFIDNKWNYISQRTGKKNIAICESSIVLTVFLKQICCLTGSVGGCTGVYDFQIHSPKIPTVFTKEVYRNEFYDFISQSNMV